MIPLIYDRPDCQSFYKRLIENTLTGAGWAFWLYLWSPGLCSIAIAHTITPQRLQSTPWPSQPAIAPMMSHVTLVTLCVAIFLAWAFLQGWRNRQGQRELCSQDISADTLAQSMALRADDLSVWQQTQRMVVSHDEALGWIDHVEVLAA